MKEKDFVVVAFTFHIYGVSMINSVERISLLYSHKRDWYKRIEAHLSFEYKALCQYVSRYLEFFEKIEKQISEFELPHIKISENIMQDYESHNTTSLSTKSFSSKIKLNFSKKNSILSEKDIQIIQHQLKKLRESLWEIIGL